MKQKSIEEMEQELAALAGTRTVPEQPTKHVNDNQSEEYNNFEKHPITEDERKEFDRAVAEYNRRRYALDSDPDPDDPEGYVARQRMVNAMLRMINREKTK